MAVLRPLAVILAVFAWLGAALAEEPQSLQPTPLVIETAGGAFEFDVEVAETAEQQRIGLMHRESMPDYHGMLFVYPRLRVITMWMKNTHIPLDMLFVGEGGAITRIAEDTEPFSLAVISSRTPAKAVLELNAGTARRLGIGVGDVVRHEALGNLGSGEGEGNEQ